MNRNSSVFIAALLIAGLSLLAGCGGGGGGSNQNPPANGDLIWAQTSSPINTNPSFTINHAEAYAMVVDQGAIYVAGYDDSNPSGYDNWRIEKRRLTDGALVGGFGTNGVISYPSTSVARHYVALAIAKDSNSLYVGGYDCPDYDAVTGLPVNAQWRIEKRSLVSGLTTTFGGGTGVVSSVTSTWDNAVNAIAVDEAKGSMYVVGYDTVTKPTPSVPEWRIEKRKLVDGSPELVSFGTPTTPGYVVSSPGGKEAIAYAIAIDANYMYVAGYDANTGGIRRECRIEKRLLDTGALEVTSFGTPTTPGYVVTDLGATGLDCVLNAIAIDTVHNSLYVAGYDINTATVSPEWRIEKRDLTYGALDVASFGTTTGSGTTGYITSDPSSGDDTAYSIALDIANGALYVTGSQDIKTPLNWEWRIEKRNLLSGATITAFGTNGAVVENPSAGDDVPSAIALDPTNPYIYMAGHFDYSAATSAKWRIEKRLK